jgi:hypothetical protein
MEKASALFISPTLRVVLEKAKGSSKMSVTKDGDIAYVRIPKATPMSKAIKYLSAQAQTSSTTMTPRPRDASPPPRERYYNVVPDPNPPRPSDPDEEEDVYRPYEVEKALTLYLTEWAALPGAPTEKPSEDDLEDPDNRVRADFQLYLSKRAPTVMRWAQEVDDIDDVDTVQVAMGNFYGYVME